MSTAAVIQTEGASRDLQRKRVLISLLAVVWLLGSGWTLYALQTADQRLFDPTVLTTPDYPLSEVKLTLLQSLPDTGTALIVHAWDERCSCAESALQHLVSMRSQILEAGARVVLLARPEDAERAEIAAERLAQESGMPMAGVILDEGQALVPASPAAMVVSAGGDLVYLGPYSAGGACVTSLGGFVESSLRVAPEDFQDTWVNRSVMGCYCDWRQPAPKSA